MCSIGIEKVNYREQNYVTDTLFLTKVAQYTTEIVAEQNLIFIFQ